MEELKQLPILFLGLAIAGVIAGTGILTSVEFSDTMDQCIDTDVGAVYNTTIGGCQNSTGGTWGISATNVTPEYAAMLEAIDGQGEVTNQFPVIGVIAVMVIIIGLIAGTFVYMRFFQG